MSKPDKQMHRDFSKFDAMRTEELEEILFQDSKLPEEASDVSAILYIADVLAKRKENHPDVDAAWASFREHYLPDADGVSLYEDEEDAAKSRTKKKRGRFFHTAAAAAAVVLVLFVGSLTARADGYDFWSSAASWSKNTFSFGPAGTASTEEQADKEPKNELQLALDQDGVTEVKAPTYIPEGYEFYTLTKTGTSGDRSYSVSYMRMMGADPPVLLSIDFSGQVGGQYSKGAGDPEIYKRNGTEYYIMTCYGGYMAVWRAEPYECSISVVPTREDLIRMIDSMEEAK